MPKLDPYARKELRKRMTHTELTVDVVAFAASLGITNKLWIAELREGLTLAQECKPLPRFTPMDNLTRRFCVELGHVVGNHLTSQPEFEKGMKIIRPTPRKPKMLRAPSALGI